MIIVYFWIQNLDRSEKLDSNDQCNKMHITGAAIAILLFRCQHTKSNEETLFSLFGKMYSSIIFLDRDDYVMSELTIEQIHDIIVSLQVEFEKCYEFDAEG